MSRSSSVLTRCCLLLIAALLSASLAAPAARSAPAPLGTTPITPSAAQCGKQTSVATTAACGAALRDKFLRARGQSDVVRHTVVTPPGWGWGWWSQAGPTICGYADFPAVPGLPVLAVGTHHCDRTTFVVANRDQYLFADDLRATVVLIHESGHGVQERAGADVVLPTLLGDVATQKPLEQSADCWAGVGIGYLIAEGDLPASARDGALALMNAVGDGVPGTMHGTGAERQAAFEAGLRDGVRACNALAGRRMFA
ncbi:hypothetical protein [Gordonia sp. (in: high G+C Gram-positive bacteria)]|uniref:hypothetical protein n=1 Tax=Gordonia sp. (in: high G+C Gram-positive bacteria) TaxID=84139 RepID=UPI003C74E1EA